MSTEQTGRMTDEAAELLQRWVMTATAVGAAGPIAEVGQRLIAAYAEPHRRYHDLLHLREVLDAIDALAAAAGDADTVRLAAWFHDVVYDPRAADNEERSAVRAEHDLGLLGVPSGEVARLVRLTATHQPAEDDRDGAVLCDADLAILARGPERYAEYAAAVREEYAHVPDAQFAAARATILRGLLAAPRLYRTPEAQAWEPRARTDVGTELMLLEASAAADPRPADG